MVSKIGVSTAWSERDESGLTDRESLDVLGLAISSAIVTWLLFELTQAAIGVYPDGSLLPLVVMVSTLGSLLYTMSWVGELLRHTILFAGTWRYGRIV